MNLLKIKAEGTLERTRSIRPIPRKRCRSNSAKLVELAMTLFRDLGHDSGRPALYLEVLMVRRDENVRSVVFRIEATLI